MKNYQDTETGKIHAFEDDVDPHSLNNRNIPLTLSEVVKQKPDGPHVWFQGDWIKQEDAPPGYKEPVSSVPSYNPAWMAYLRPYTAIHRDEHSSLGISIEQINNNSYDGRKLAEVVGVIPLGLASGIPALISYDGAIAIPQCEDFPSRSRGLDKINEILCSLLLGGIHCEVIHPDNMTVGSLMDGKTIFDFTPSMHSRLRLNCASMQELFLPLMHPRILNVKDLQKAHCDGRAIIRAINNFSPYFLLNGYSAMINQNNGDALNNLWIVVEQLTENLWISKYKKMNNFPQKTRKIYHRLKNENKINLVSSKHILLRLTKFISRDCYISFSRARDARNKLAHSGKIPESEIIANLWKAIPSLIEEAAGIQGMGMRGRTAINVSNWPAPVKTNFDEWVALAKNM
ncbi:MAG: hypothetical protein P4M05_10415 [Bradyrhizobium sp.]|nr:hypothetical protein [Bradyrhizobium sp.]